ncbi:hypothetical protein [Kitasatospora sp. NPDC059327]|uniref:hypothetical protein n=1 Tax=Kitasatospora sp. NPDC059327 TaxID=3346803 RepID=UPI0036BE87E5
MASATSRLVGYYSRRDVAQDFRVWRRREYLQHPKINGDDSPFGAYRLWARQFYPPKDPA